MAFHDQFYENIVSKCLFHTISINWQFKKEMSSHHNITVYHGIYILYCCKIHYAMIQEHEWIPDIHFFVDFI